MNRRLFIAIDLSADVKKMIGKEIEQDEQKGYDLYKKGRMIPKENWHFTLVFLGDQPEERITAIKEAIRETVTRIAAPEISIQTLTTAPPKRPPRMVWAVTNEPTSHRLEALKTEIENALVARGVEFDRDTRPYHGHITLVRLAEGMRIADHAVSFPHALSFQPKTVNLMESRLESTGAEYSTLESIDFKPSI